MNRISTLIALAVLALAAAVGCQPASSGTGARSQAPRSTSQEPPAAGAGEGHAAANVTPGSYEDWCAEHQVPETQCTRCDPSLIPAFQAVNDWCPEHGLPMSQCLKHNPNLRIVRPPKPEGQ